MHAELKSIFGEYITVGGKRIPTAHLRYNGDSKTFITWTVVGDAPALIGDDACLYSTVEVDVDIFSDENYLNAISEVRNLMESNEWIWVEDSPEMFEEDTGLYHLTITYEKERSN